MAYPLVDGRNDSILYQWDSNRFILCDATYMEWNGVEGRVVGENGRIAIPNILLQTAGEIYGWIECVDSDGQFTRQKLIYKVIAREKPVDYVYTETEVQTVEKIAQALVDVETSRAEGAESTLSDAISAETTRAESAETNLSASIVAEASRAKTAEEKIDTDLLSENARAISAEQGLADSISAEASRAKEAESDLASALATEVTRAKASEKLNADAISAESARAIAKEKELEEKACKVTSVNGKDGDVVLTAEDVNALPDTTEIPSKLSDLEEDSTHRVVTDSEKTIWNGKQDAISDLDAIRSGASKGATAVQTETDPTVPDWAKASTKPTYTASEVGADASGSASKALTDAKAYTDAETTRAKEVESTQSKEIAGIQEDVAVCLYVDSEGYICLKEA